MKVKKISTKVLFPLIILILIVLKWGYFAGKEDKSRNDKTINSSEKIKL